MEALTMDVNWTAVLVGAAVSFLVGWVWYSPILFQKKWLQGVGVAADDTSSMMHAMVAQVVSTILLAWVVGVTVVIGSVELALLIAVTIAVLIKANGLFSQKSHYAIAVESGFIMVMVLIMLGTHSIL